MKKWDYTIQQAVKKSGLSLYALAKLSGVSQPVLSRFMSGQRGLNLETAEKIGKCLGLELKETKK